MPFAGLFWIIVVLAVAGVLLWGLNSLPAIDPTIKQVIKVLIIVVVVIWVIMALAGMLGVGVPHWR